MSKKLKRVIQAVAVIVILFLAYIVFVPYSNEPGLNVKAKLIVNGQAAADGNTYIYQRGSVYLAEVPLLETIRLLGYDVHSEREDLTVIHVQDKDYYLSGHKLYSDNNLICEVAAFDNAFYSWEGDPAEPYVNRNEELIAVLEEMGISPVEIEINPKERTVVVSTK